MRALPPLEDAPAAARDWIAVGGAVVLFDGVCNLCHFAVRFIAPRDKGARIRFAPLDSATGRWIAAAWPEGPPDSVFYVDQAGASAKSEAALRIVRHFSGAWRLLAVARVLPRPLRDAAYSLVARVRYRVFGKKDTCPAPSAELNMRFLPGDADGAKNMAKPPSDGAPLALDFARLTAGRPVVTLNKN